MTTNKTEKICKCPCHKEGFATMHIMPCCELTYLKYIKEDGTVDIAKYNQLKIQISENT